MKLSDAGQPEDLWIYAERYLGAGTRAYSRFSEDMDVSAPYHPQLGDDTFALPTFRLPRDLGGFRVAAHAGPAARSYGGAGEFLLPVHPDTLAAPDLADRDRLLSCPPGPVLEVAPTANVRTVVVRRVDGAPAPPHFLKLHFPRRLSRFTRRLRRPMIELQMWVSEEFRRAGVPALPEVAGGFLGADPLQAWGYLVREWPAGLPAGAYVVPLFALYGTDRRDPAAPTLFEQLVTEGGHDPQAFLRDQIVAMVRLWCAAVRTTGCVPEMHGQNTLVAFDRESGRSWVLYRDCGVYVDPGRRPAAGPLPPVNVLGRDVRVPAGHVLSLAYDSFLGHHALAPLVDLAVRRYGVDVVGLRDAARQTFAGELPGAGLPDTVFYYDDALHPDGGWALRDTGRKPDWR